LSTVFVDQVDHLCCRGFDAYEDGAGDDAVAYVEFTEVGYCGDGADVVVCQAVACVDDEAVVKGEVFAGSEFLYFSEGGFFGFGVGVGAGVEFNGVAAGFSGGSNLGLIGGYEGAYEDAFLVHSFDDLGQTSCVFDAVEAAFCCEFSPVFRDEGNLVGADLLGYFDDGLRHAHFEVEFAGDGFLEEADVAVVDVAAVLAEVDGDSVGAGELALDSGPDGVRLDGPAGLADRCYMVYVYIQDCHVLILDQGQLYIGTGAGIKQISAYLIAKSRCGD
jgi:hypothetical protein